MKKSAQANTNIWYVAVYCQIKHHLLAHVKALVKAHETFRNYRLIYSTIDGEKLRLPITLSLAVRVYSEKLQLSNVCVR